MSVYARQKHKTPLTVCLSCLTNITKLPTNLSMLYNYLRLQLTLRHDQLIESGTVDFSQATGNRRCYFENCEQQHRFQRKVNTRHLKLLDLFRVFQVKKL